MMVYAIPLLLSVLLFALAYYVGRRLIDPSWSEGVRLTLWTMLIVMAACVVGAARLPELVEQLFEAMDDGEAGAVFRPGLRPGDVGQFLVTTSLSMLLGVIPGIDDPETARRYVQTFVLPAILAEPPAPREVFGR